ncbi:hypothetical protein BIY37_04715 [Candidatus Brocadia sapporoensis]|uniref:RNA polymerase sigma-70 region 2 domain-containing protein n=1 Tax=Candidatus Brocadia sapporoensis TaxID=392547 RepID=A0A1V6M1B7_9BACT|nr:sigma-70 family RNA polymerase sigma factor [Candidatus Brocadia sapporoensis]OQD46126.1 hypothetical protein BIY37_04715 [Candidatus Brocadia sapporoensis]GJQ23587.1 MAG: hypothetical protein HBSAPP01_13770 [Candidatus Brocadia sapporoensis]
MNYDYPLLDTLENCGIDLVAYVVDRDFKNAMQYIEKDDLVGYGVLGLLKAARKYDPARGVSFVTFACKKARQAIMSFVRQKCQKANISLNALNLNPYDNTDLFAEYDAEDEMAYVRCVVNGLPEPHKGFVGMYYLDEISVKETMQATGLKRNALFRLRTQSLALLKLRIGNNPR